MTLSEKVDVPVVGGKTDIGNAIKQNNSVVGNEFPKFKSFFEKVCSLSEDYCQERIQVF